MVVWVSWVCGVGGVNVLVWDWGDFEEFVVYFIGYEGGGELAEVLF